MAIDKDIDQDAQEAAPKQFKKDAAVERFERIKALCSKSRTQQDVHMPLEIQTQILGYLEEEKDYTTIARMSQVSLSWYHTFSAEHLWMARAKLHGAKKRAPLCDWLVTFTKSYSKVCFHCFSPAADKYDHLPNSPSIRVICYNCIYKPQYATLNGYFCKQAPYNLTTDDLATLKPPSPAIAPEAIEDHLTHKYYLKASVAALAQRKREDARTALIDNFPGDSTPLEEAFVYCSKLAANSDEHVMVKYIQLLRGGQVDIEQALIFATYFTSLPFVEGDVRARLEQDGQQEKEDAALVQLESRRGVEQGIRWKEALADGLKTMDQFMAYLNRPSPATPPSSSQQSIRPCTGANCNLTYAAACTLRLCAACCTGPCQRHRK